MKTKTTTLLILTLFLAGLTLAQNTDMTEEEVKESVSEHIETMIEIDQNNNQKINDQELIDVIVAANEEDKYTEEINTATAANSICENLLSEALNGDYTYSSRQTGCVR